MRPVFVALLLLLAAAPAAADPHAAVATDAVLTRYGDSHKTINVLSVDSALEVKVTSRLAVGIRLPLATHFANNGGCCGYTLGNATGQVRFALEREAVEADLLTSFSLPTAATEGNGATTSRYAATAAVTRDAALYIPDMAAGRLGLAVRVPAGTRSWVAGSAGAHLWIDRSAGHRNQVVLPFELAGGRRISSHLSGTAAFTTVASPSQTEAFLHAASVGIAYAGTWVGFGARVHMPLDESLRELGMVGVGTNLTAAF